QLYSIARLLVFVQMIMLFQEKTYRIFGQLCVFSLLQVVVASLLSVSLGFGILLFSYAIIAIVTMALFSNYKLLRRIQTKKSRRTLVVCAECIDDDDETKLESPWTFLLGGEYKATAKRSYASQLDGIVSRGFFKHMFGSAAVVLLFVIVFFYAIPRSGSSAWQHPGMTGRQRTGLTREMQLGSIGNILRDDSLALRVVFIKESTGEPFEAVDPYLVGTYLTKYDTSDDGHANWQAPTVSLHPGMYEVEYYERYDDHLEYLVRQDITMELTYNNLKRSSQPLLVGVDPSFRIHETPEKVRRNPYTGQLFLDTRSRTARVDQMRYELITTAYANRSGVAETRTLTNQNQIRPIFIKGSPQRRRYLGVLRECSGYPQSLSQLKEFTDTLLEEETDLDRTNVTAVSSFLSNFLRSNTDYKYSLSQFDVASQRNQNIDPVVDFVINHKTGHCEYFASALTLMLRTQGFKSRVVMGYFGGEYNRVGKHYRMANSNAHAWVEVLIPPAEVGEVALEYSDAELMGGWMRLDPTPLSEESITRSMVDDVVDSFEYLQYLWDNYVLRVDPSDQSKMFGAMGMENVGHENAELSVRFLQMIGVDFSKGLLRNLLNPTVLVFILVGFVLLLIVAKMVGTFVKGGTRRRQRRGGSLQATIAVYLKLEQILARHKIVRQHHQTQLEFAVLVGSRLSTSGLSEDICSLPKRIVELFYQLRFGDSELDMKLEANLLSELAILRTALAENSKSR
ncbi:MAG: DUF3488 and DUF4129 domain-containing transglutaminase family protein, partial [Pirellulaceae bacterium]